MVVNSFSFVARRTPWESFVKVVIMVMVRRLQLCVAALSTYMVVTVAVDHVMVSAFIQQTTVAAIPHRHHLKKYKQVRSCCNCCRFNISWCSKGVVVGSSALFWLEFFPLELQTSEMMRARNDRLQRWILFSAPLVISDQADFELSVKGIRFLLAWCLPHSPILVHWWPYSSRLLQLNNLGTYILATVLNCTHKPIMQDGLCVDRKTVFRPWGHVP
jgi:hypothetical protein